MNRDKHIDNPSVDTLTSVVEGLARRLVDVSKIGQDRRERSCILNSSQIIVEIAILSTPNEDQSPQMYHVSTHYFSSFTFNMEVTTIRI